MKRSLYVRTAFVACVTLISIFGLIGFPASKQELIQNWRRNIRLGTDLRGGLQLVAKVNWREARSSDAPSSQNEAQLRETVMRQTREVMLKKVNALDLTEATVRPVARSGAEDELLIEIPGVDDPARIRVSWRPLPCSSGCR